MATFGFRKMLCQGAGIAFGEWSKGDMDAVIRDLQLQLATVAKTYKVAGCQLRFKSSLQAEYALDKVRAMGLESMVLTDNEGYSVVDARWGDFYGDPVDRVILEVSPQWQYVAMGKQRGLDIATLAHPQPRTSPEVEAAVSEVRLAEIKAGNSD